MRKQYAYSKASNDEYRSKQEILGVPWFCCCGSIVASLLVGLVSLVIASIALARLNTKELPNGLIGFFHVSEANTNAGVYSDMANYDKNTGLQLTDRLQPTVGYWRVSNAQFGRGKTSNTIASLFDNEFNDFNPYLVEYDRTTGKTTYLKVVGMGSVNNGVLDWDSVSQKYLASSRGLASTEAKDSIYSIDPNTGVATELSTVKPPTPDERLYAMVNLGESIFIPHRRAGGLDMYQFNRTTGDYINNIAINATYTFLGNVFPILNEEPNMHEAYLGMTYDPVDKRIYFINSINEYQRTFRVLCYVQGQSESELETILASGNLPLNVLPYAPNQVLHALLYLQ